MTKTKRKVKKQHRKTKKNRRSEYYSADKIIKMLQKGDMKISVIDDRKGTIVQYRHDDPYIRPYIQDAIHSLRLSTFTPLKNSIHTSDELLQSATKFPVTDTNLHMYKTSPSNRIIKHPKHESVMTCVYVDNVKNCHIVNRRKTRKCISGGDRKSSIEIFFFPSYLKQLNPKKSKTLPDDKYARFLIVNNTAYPDFQDFLNKKMEDVDEMFAFTKLERNAKTAKPTGVYKHVVDLTLLTNKEGEGVGSGVGDKEEKDKKEE